jgi:hypothetical protein
VSVGGVEGKAENTVEPIRMNSTKTGQLGGVFQRLLQQTEVPQAPFAQRQHQCAQRAHGTTFGGCGNAQKNRAQHQKNQDQRRHEHEGHLLGQARQQFQAQ